MIGDVCYITLSQGRVAMIDVVDADLGRMRWSARKNGANWYAMRPDRRGYGASKVFMHRVIARRAGLAIDGLEVDHANGNGLDNRRANLRAATTSQNQMNRRGPQRNSKSGIRGVSWHARDRIWRAQISVHGKRLSLGHFDNAEQASAAYARAAEMLHGEFTRVRGGG